MTALIIMIAGYVVAVAAVLSLSCNLKVAGRPMVYLAKVADLMSVGDRILKR
jgi:hypothetical protein